MKGSIKMFMPELVGCALRTVYSVFFKKKLR